MKPIKQIAPKPITRKCDNRQTFTIPQNGGQLQFILKNKGEN
jgi:hypothetical protein